VSKLRVNAFSISLDGYGAGANQTLDQPLGKGGEALHEWMVTTRTFQQLYGDGAGTTGTDDELTARGFENAGAWILGRNMFGPVRGEWPEDTWRGWWGESPPYHVPVFVLTHYPRAPLTMEGDTTFHFITDGIESALKHAKQAAGGQDVRVGGGVSVIRQYLQARLIDQLHIAISPIVLGSGEHLFAGLDLLSLGYNVVEHVTTPNAMHLVIAKVDA
jgi:dihydrofolate reductase